jgi:hypothetical protein
MANTYTAISNVSFGDTWSAGSHNNLMGNAAGAFLSASVIQLFPAQGANVPLTGGVAALEYVESTDAGTRKPAFMQLRFDDTTSEARMWQFVMPYTVTAPVLKVGYRMAGANTSKSVKFDAYLACVSDGDTSVNAKAFSSVNSATVTCPDAANTFDVATITLTNADSIAEGDLVTILLARDTGVASDATGDAIVMFVDFQYV